MTKEKKKGNVVLIDNCSGNNLLLENILDMEGYSVNTCLEPDNAVEVIKKLKPDLLLIDIMVPELKGFDVLRVIKTTEDISKIPVIIVSTRSEVIDLNKAKKQGADDLIIKPVDIRTIMRKIERLVH